MPPQLLAAVDDTVVVEFSQFVLQETPMSRLALELWPESGDFGIAVGGPGGLLCKSSATDHYPDVRIELWSAAPPESDAEWEERADVTIQVTGDVRLQSVTAALSERVLRLPQPGEYKARVHVRGGRQARRLGEASFAEHVERWLIQLWPLVVGSRT